MKTLPVLFVLLVLSFPLAHAQTRFPGNVVQEGATTINTMGAGDIGVNNLIVTNSFNASSATATFAILNATTLNVNNLVVTNTGRIFVQTNTVILTNSTTTTALLSGKGTTNISANLLAVGTTIRINLYGIYFTDAVPAGTTLTMRVLLNGVVLVQTPVVAPPGGHAGQSWRLVTEAVVRKTGASGLLMPGGMMTYGSGGAAALPDTQGMPAVTTTTIDTTAAITMSVDATLNNTTDAVAIWCQGGTIELIP